MQSPIAISALLKAALAEDIGMGDVTSIATIPSDVRATFVMRAREEMVVAGLVFLPELFAMLDADVRVTLQVRDGDKVEKGAVLATLEGPARALLSGERVALNLVQQLSGVATLTRAYVDAIVGTNAQILDTRKTIPGLRLMQKYAVTCGGGVNHRMGLYDAILIKDNHIAVAGGVTAAVMAAQNYIETEIEAGGAAAKSPPPEGEGRGGGRLEARSCPTPAPIPTFPLRGKEIASRCIRRSETQQRSLYIEIECDTLAQLDEALAAGVDTVLLDNMSNDQLREAVAIVRLHNTATKQSVKTEASGNVSLATVRAIAETGVDYISVGKLTHSAVAVDVGLDTME